MSGHPANACTSDDLSKGQDRYADLRRIAQNNGLDAVALVPGANFERLFNKTFHQNERPLVVVIPVAGPPAAVVPNLELGSFALLDFEGMVFDWRDQDGYDGAFAALAAHLPLRRLGVEGQEMRVFVHHALRQALPSLEIVDAHQAISALRICKQAHEITALSRAIDISQQALERTLAHVCVGMAETEIEALLVQHLFAQGAQGLAFPPIVAAGDNSARPHAKARHDYAVRAGDALLLDFGARYDGLCADLTRTVFVGCCDDEQRAVYETVLAANLAGIGAARPGASAHDVDDAALSVLEASDYGARVRTKTGHGLGRDVHEAPYIMRGNHLKLAPGMVFTVEPGLYQLDHFGVRIEDDVLITPTGAKVLTTFSRELTFVG